MSKSLQDSLRDLLESEPDPEACPQCGSTDFAPIERPPRPESADGDAGLTLNLMYCGWYMDHDRWECRSCGHRWHEEPPKMSDEEWV